MLIQIPLPVSRKTATKIAKKSVEIEIQSLDIRKTCIYYSSALIAACFMLDEMGIEAPPEGWCCRFMKQTRKKCDKYWEENHAKYEAELKSIITEKYYG